MTASSTTEATESDVDAGQVRPGPAWVPADACRLPTEEQPFRLAAFENLFATATQALERVAPNRLRLELSPTPPVAAEVAELAAREAECCGFFTFTLTAAADSLGLEIAVPEHRSGVLDGLAAQATSPGARA